MLQAVGGGKVRAGLVLHQQGVTQVGDHVGALSEQDPVGGVSIIHLQYKPHGM